uniref:Uncharacterized protein n=1 Tax=Pithovirus LCDPAC02 TaxID=2506601 RepID=A0A481YQ52_9VIRU|nr:MAG: hypothetical protein LCDPAC02_02460 [Pithovirus LCDPAC02]
MLQQKLKHRDLLSKKLKSDKTTDKQIFNMFKILSTIRALLVENYILEKKCGRRKSIVNILAHRSDDKTLPNEVKAKASYIVNRKTIQRLDDKIKNIQSIVATKISTACIDTKPYTRGQKNLPPVLLDLAYLVGQSIINSLTALENNFGLNDAVSKGGFVISGYDEGNKILTIDPLPFYTNNGSVNPLNSLLSSGYGSSGILLSILPFAYKLWLSSNGKINYGNVKEFEDYVEFLQSLGLNFNPSDIGLGQGKNIAQIYDKNYEDNLGNNLLGTSILLFKRGRGNNKRYGLLHADGKGDDYSEVDVKNSLYDQIVIGDRKLSYRSRIYYVKKEGVVLSTETEIGNIDQMIAYFIENPKKGGYAFYEREDKYYKSIGGKNGSVTRRIKRKSNVSPETAIQNLSGNLVVNYYNRLYKQDNTLRLVEEDDRPLPSSFKLIRNKGTWSISSGGYVSNVVKPINLIRLDEIKNKITEMSDESENSLELINKLLDISNEYPSIPSILYSKYLRPLSKSSTTFIKKYV